MRKGVYTQEGTTYNGKPVYRNGEHILYYYGVAQIGWAIGPNTQELGVKSTVCIVKTPT